MTENRRIPAGPFPDWARNHRTLQEVARTDALLITVRDGKLLLNIEKCELEVLLIKAKRNNPPADGQAGAA